MEPGIQASGQALGKYNLLRFDIKAQGRISFLAEKSGDASSLESNVKFHAGSLVILQVWQMEKDLLDKS